LYIYFFFLINNRTNPFYYYSATEFQLILAKHPPQVSSREAASQWACAVHNIVNQRLQKDTFDCGKIAEKYKCGCDDENKSTQV